ncbi:MAG: cadherin-like beta sandwich domain-containing protein, partial [Bacilli bacterium]|nr:cadherin-like beta sandwich domain-containing protein [Bacilli bacterium]
DDPTSGYDYLINVQYEIPDIIIEGIANSKTSKVTGNGYYSLQLGNNDITLRVTSETGNYKDYVVRVVRDLSTNDDLSFLYVEEGGLIPRFNETTIYYNVKIPNEKTEVHITALPEDKDATVDIVGDTTGLEVGVPREIQVVVTAPKGNQKTYTLSITRQEATTENLALFKLETNRGELTPTFDPDTLNYTLEVENNIQDITVTAQTLSDNVKVMGTGKYNLKVGKNGITVFVVGEDEVQRDYQIVVTRKKSKDATLSALVVKGHALSPKFNKNTLNYTLKTSGTYLDFTTIQPTESESTYVVSGNEDFTTGENTVTIEVTAPDGETTKTYTLTVTKSGSKNNNLSSLAVEGYMIIPNFHKVITFYSLEVPNDLNSVVITATAEDENATITGTGLQKIETGENYFEIVVTSEAGTEKKYTILINKEASDNNYLGSLFLSDGELTPEFDKEESNYEVTVPYTVSEITLTGDPEDSHATVTGLDTYTLVEGDNTIVITVTSESGLVRTYTVKVTREETISAYLTSLEAEGYELDAPFNKELFEYYITVGNEVTELDLSYTTEDKHATVEVTGNENFNIGMNEVHIEVTSSDGNLTEEYILYVNREFSTNNYLNTLTIDKGTLDPEFDPKILIYNVEVDRDVEKITVSATTEDASSTIVSGTGEHELKLGNNVIQVKVRSSIGITRTYKINVLR